MQTITVDMTPGFRQPTIHYSQNDVGTTFAIDLRSRFGDTLPASPTVKIQATKPSGFGFSIEADSVVDSVATFTTVATMTDEAGRFLAELEVSDSGVVLYTANFYMEGEANPHPIGTTDGSQETIIPTLTLLVERVEAAAESVLDMTVNATTLAAGSQATYSYDEDTNTATFGIPQGEAGAGAAGVVASAYSSSSTYAVGDYVIHNSNLYRCTTAITTAEAFTAAHWTQIVLADDVSDLKSDFNAYLVDNTDAFPISWNATNGFIKISDGGVSTASSCKRTDFLALPKDAVGLYFSRPISDNVNHPNLIAAVAFYTSNSVDSYMSANAISMLNGATSNGYKNTYVNIPSGAKYVRLTTRNGIESSYFMRVFYNDNYNDNLDVVSTINDVSTTTKPYVLVLNNNDSSYGDGGNCLMGQMSRTSLGYSRNNGTRIYPMPNQVAPTQSNAPQAELLEVIKSYVGNNSLQYGQTKTLYSDTCTDEIDCSSFVTAVLQGVTYDKSRYSLGTAEKNIIGTYPADALFYYNNSYGYGRYTTTNMAIYFAEHKQLFELPSDSIKATNMLQFGDVLFMSSGNAEDGYYGITHVAIVIGTIPKQSKVIIAEAGTSPSGLTLYSNESTVCKTSMLSLSSSVLASAIRVFARPRYHNTIVQNNDVLPFFDFAVNGACEYQDIYFLQNTTLDADGDLSFSQTNASTAEFYRAVGGAKILFTGTYTDGGGTIINRQAYQYDKSFNLITSGNISPSTPTTLNANTRYLRFCISYAVSAGKQILLSQHELFKVKIYV